MKRIAVSAVAWFVASSVVPTFGQTPNLSGTWQLDTGCQPNHGTASSRRR